MAVEAHMLATHAEWGSNRERSEGGSGALVVFSFTRQVMVTWVYLLGENPLCCKLMIYMLSGMCLNVNTKFTLKIYAVQSLVPNHHTIFSVLCISQLTISCVSVSDLL